MFQGSTKIRIRLLLNDVKNEGSDRTYSTVKGVFVRTAYGRNQEA
jgi:hypothetical protein